MTSRSRRWKLSRVALLLVSCLMLGTTLAAAAIGWENLIQQVPPARSGHAMAYDSPRGRVVLFGGNGSSGYLDDTWEWDGTAWANVTPAVSPPARGEHAMAYDSARGRVVLFGGYGSGHLADTWEWDGTAWTNVTPAVSPSARSGHAMAFDSARDRVVLFGGRNRLGQGLADTWEWDGTAWMNVTPAVSPSPRTYHALAYDSARGRVILFGGEVGSGYLPDTWEWDGTAWVEITPAVSPSARSGQAMAYDSARGRVVLFGGNGSTGELVDTWEWVGIAWMNVTPAVSPSARSGHAMAYDSARGRVVLFGGSSVGDDTWEWDGSAWLKGTPAVSPYTRAFHAMAYDSARGGVVLFGGYRPYDGFNSGSSGFLADTWEWDGAAWMNVTPAVSPPGRASHAMAYDNARNRAVLFGGKPSDTIYGELADTWEWDGTAWVEITPAVSPSARWRHAMAYDSARGRAVLFGGGRVSLGYLLADTWEWDGAVWMNVTPAVSPPGREFHALAYDSARSRVVLFGGAGSGGYLADTWEWDGAAWVEVTPAVSPSARSGHAMAYDSARGRVVLFGGDGSSGNLADTWEWDGAAWVEVTPAVSPSPRAYHALAYDSARGRAVLLGGSPSSGAPPYLRDTWEYGPLERICDGLDDDGNGLVDEGCDDDGDGYCDANMAVVGLPVVCPLGPGDCNDGNAAVHPGAAEICDGLDNDCDGQVDNGVAPCCAPSSMIGWWAGDGSPRDLLGRNPGSLVGGAGYATGVVGQAFSFDGTDDYVLVPHAPSLNPTGSFSIEAWILPAANNGYGMIFSKWRDDSSRAYQLSAFSGLGIEFAISDDAHQGDTSFHRFQAPGVLTLGVWTHVAAVYDQPTGTRFIFINGMEAARRTDPPITVTNSPADVGIGAVPPGAVFAGLIDEVTFYDKALSPSEINAIYLAGSTGKCLPGDQDGDRFASPEDCDDANATVYPSAPQLCDGINHDCTDPNWPALPISQRDADGDGFRACAGDCDDTNPSIHPGAAEVCNNVDDSCNGQTDEGLGATTCGVGACQRTIDNCVGGAVQTCTPGAPSPETCDNLDNNCNGQVDDGLGFASCGTGACLRTVPACVAGGTPVCTPGAPSPEVCNGIDDDCNGVVDEDASGVDSDADGVHNACDNCRFAFNPSQSDTDHDRVGNACDNCLTSYNPSQMDTDSDQRGDVCDNCPADYNPAQDNGDGDRAGDVCDNCPFTPNDDQADFDHDFEGDVCDLNDGLIMVSSPASTSVLYQREQGFSSYNVYRGDMKTLKTTGVFTQDPSLVPAADQFCGMTTGSLFDPYVPGVGKVVYYLVTGVQQGGESSLGIRSNGAPRPNDNPCY